MTESTFTESVAVQRYIGSLDGMTPAEKDERLKTLADFTAFVERTPDEMVAEIFNVETRKYRKRGFYSDKIKEFSAQLDGPRSLQIRRGNVIRSFFIANGRRVPPDTPDWMLAKDS
jgi:hypothetical protein